MAPPQAELMSSTVTIDDLPDEVLTEVMLRVPTPASLVNAAAASKRWRGIIAHRDRKFLNDYRERHKSSPFLGLYIPREFGGLPSFLKADSIQSAGDDDNGDLDLQRAAAKAFSLGGLASHPEWRLLDCYNSRLLLVKGDKSLEVYNALSCERIFVRLPQDDILPDDFSACLLQGHDDDAASFRVVSVQHQRRARDRMVRAVEYDSRSMSWMVHDWGTLKNIEGTEQGKLMHAGNLIFCKYTGTSLLLLDTRKMQFSALPLPADNNWKHYAIGEMEDGVCCLASVDSVGIWNKSHLRVWKLEKMEWKLEKEMRVEQVLGKHVHLRRSYYKVRAVTNGIALLCSSSSTHQLHFVVDLKTFYVKDKFEFKDLPAYPMQMPWPPAFSVATVSGEGKNSGSSDGNDDNRPELKDGAASQNCMPSNAQEDLGIQDPVTSVPTATAAEDCFEKENNVPEDYDLEASIPDLCDQVSGLMHPEVARLHRPERTESLVRLEEQGAQCPFAVSNELHPEHCIKDSESPHVQERKHNWGPIQVFIKMQTCLEDWDGSEGENPWSCEWDNVSLEGITDFQDYMKFQQMDSSNQFGNGVSESNTLVIPDQDGVEHDHFNGRVQEGVSVHVTGQAEGSLEPDGAISTVVQDSLTLQANLDGQYVESKLNRDSEIPCDDDVVILGCSDVCGSHDIGPELRDDGAHHNFVPSDALEDLGIQAEECFDKEADVPNDHDLETPIPVQDLSLCNEDSDLICTEAEPQSNERLSSDAARAQRRPEDKRRSNRAPKPNRRVQGPDWVQ